MLQQEEKRGSERKYRGRRYRGKKDGKKMGTEGRTE